MSRVLEVDRPDSVSEGVGLNEQVAPQPVSPEPPAEPGAVPPEGPGVFDYRPVPVLAPVAAILGVASLFGLWFLTGLGVAIVGVVVGAVAVRKIGTSDGELGGMVIASFGLVTSVLLLVAGTGRHAYLIATEVPEGYRRVNFAHDISQHPIRMLRGRIAVAEPVAELTEQPIFVKGYMFPTMQTKDLTAFLLVKDNQLCCFGGQVAKSDMILVELPEGKTFDFTTGMVSVGGDFRIEPKRMADQDNPVVYRLDATLVEKSKTIF